MRIVPVWIAALALIAAGCGAASGAKGRTTVVAAFYPLAYAAEQVGGAKVDVRNLTPPGAEPHDIELTPRDVGRLQQADRSEEHTSELQSPYDIVCRLL